MKSNVSNQIAGLMSELPGQMVNFKSSVLLILAMMLLALPSISQAASPNATINSVRWEERNGQLLFHLDLNVHEMQYVDTKVLLWLKYTHNNDWVKRGGDYVMTRQSVQPRYANSHWSDLTLSIPISSIPRSINANTVTPHIEVRRSADDLTIGRWQSNSVSIRFGTQGSILLYEGNRGTQSLLCNIRYEGHSRTINLKKDNLGCENDEARSLVLQNMPAGTSIFVYDSPSCSRQADDATQIRVKRNIDSYVVNTFERSYEDRLVDVNYLTSGNLDGKVSCIQLVAP